MHLHYQRRKFLIDKPFQIRFSFYVCSWLFALSLVYPLIIYNLFEYFVHYLTLDPNGPTMEAIASVRKDVIYLLVFFQMSFLGATFLISIFVSHRIAGPLYKLKSFFRKNVQGKLSPNIAFRKNDHFKDVASEYNIMLATIRSDLDKVRNSLIESTNDLDSIIASGSGDSAKLKNVVITLHNVVDSIPK